MKYNLSIVIVSFNTKNLLDECLRSLLKLTKEIRFEIIVSDNASDDGSVELVKKKYPKVRLIENNANLGFAAGNNKARNVVKGEYVLFLNSDTQVPPNTLKQSIQFLEKNSDVGAMTCKLILPSGELDKDARRKFPTPWISFKRLFLHATSEYWYEKVDPNTIQEVDTIQGAFFLTRKKILDEVGWFDERYFLDAEDIDLCWQIKQKGYKIIYNPKVSILHVKKASKRNIRSSSVISGLKAMELFYKKNFWSEYPIWINYTVLAGIKSLWLIRALKIKIGL